MVQIPFVNIFAAHIFYSSVSFSYNKIKLLLQHQYILYLKFYYGKLPIICYFLLVLSNYCRAKNHISPEEPYFATFYYYDFQYSRAKFNHFFEAVGKKTYCNPFAKEERNLFLYKIKTLQEIQNKWRNMVTWRNMVLHSTSANNFYISS